MSWYLFSLCALHSFLSFNCSCLHSTLGPHYFLPGLLYLFSGILNMVLQVHLSKSVLKPPQLHLNYLNKSSFTFPLQSSLIWPRIYLPVNPTRTLSYSLIRLMILKTDFRFLPLRLCLFSSPVTHQLHQQLIPYLIFPGWEDDSSFLTDNKMWELSDLQHVLYTMCVFDWPKLPHSPMWEDLEGSSMPYTSLHHITYRSYILSVEMYPPKCSKESKLLLSPKWFLWSPKAVAPSMVLMID